MREPQVVEALGLVRFLGMMFVPTYSSPWLRFWYNSRSTGEHRS
jgi:hypothetical protein